MKYILENNGTPEPTVALSLRPYGDTVELLGRKDTSSWVLARFRSDGSVEFIEDTLAKVGLKRRL